MRHNWGQQTFDIVPSNEHLRPAFLQEHILVGTLNSAHNHRSFANSLPLNQFNNVGSIGQVPVRAHNISQFDLAMGENVHRMPFPPQKTSITAAFSRQRLFNDGNFDNQCNFSQGGSSHAFKESINGVFQQQQAKFGNIWNPCSVVLPSKFYENMQVYNSSMQLEVDNGLPLLADVDNGLPPLPEAYNCFPPFPEANNGLPPLPEADNGLPPLPPVVLMHPLDSLLPLQSIISESQQTDLWIPHPNQQLYSPSESEARYSSIEQHGFFSMPTLNANMNSHEKTNSMKRDFSIDLRGKDSDTVMSPLKRLKTETPCLSGKGGFHSPSPLKFLMGKSLKLPPLQQYPGLPLFTDTRTLERDVDPFKNYMEDSAWDRRRLEKTSDDFRTSSAQKRFSVLGDHVGDHNPEDERRGQNYSNVKESHDSSKLNIMDCSALHKAGNVLSPSKELPANGIPSRATDEPAAMTSNSVKPRVSWDPAQATETSDTLKSSAVSSSPLNPEHVAETKDGVIVELMTPEKDASPMLNSKKLKKSGVSLVEWFTAEQIKEHLSGLQQGTNQSIPRKQNGNKEMDVPKEEKSCPLCGAAELLFSLPPIYCSRCCGRIKASANYYSSEEKKSAHHLLCNSCYKNSQGGKITLSGGTRISKAKLLKKRNNDETDEKWVQCDSCKGWQHEICGLYNVKRDPEGEANYICPNCLLEENHSSFMDSEANMAFGAKELPCTYLSNYLEQRLFGRLRQEREETAESTGKRIDEVKGPEDLVVRVVLSADKCLKVKKQYKDIFHEGNYPSEFPYTSKVILLFQKIEGVDVCLFSLYAQEYGSECSQPDQRCIYISYLDSVKYFRPERTTSTGEALRTFVYHELLIGYLEYCKKRGFAACYLWASPPLKGEDYIFYCHPETQKTPRSDKLRHWYQSMLKKAAKEGVVLGVTNLYDQFFGIPKQSTCKVTAARLPYFDGDYWSDAAYNVIWDIEREGKDEIQKKVKSMKSRTLKALGYKNPPVHAAKDILLMQQLGQIILRSKEDFMVVHLQFCCTSCHQVILSGWRWFCSDCKNFQVCERCHGVKYKNSGEDSHYVNEKEKHLLSKVMVDDIPSTTDDNDIILENDLLESRRGFLSFCQRKRYQFDTLRRAKHSSMMILHYLHNPNELRSENCSQVTCNICNKDITTELYHHCMLCPNFTICTRCHEEEHALSNVHALPKTPSAHGIQSKDDVCKIAKFIEVLNTVCHASTCRATRYDPCSYPNCKKLKKMFKHDSKCKIRGDGGCRVCQKVSVVLAFHANHCKEPNCHAQRRRYLKSSRTDYSKYKSIVRFPWGLTAGNV